MVGFDLAPKAPKVRSCFYVRMPLSKRTFYDDLGGAVPSFLDQILKILLCSLHELRIGEYIDRHDSHTLAALDGGSMCFVRCRVAGEASMMLRPIWICEDRERAVEAGDLIRDVAYLLLLPVTNLGRGTYTHVS